MTFPFLLKVLRKDGTCAITGLCAGATANAHSSVSAMSAALLAQLGRMYGSALPAVRGIGTALWDADPYARGSYSCMGVGARPGDRGVLREVLGGVLHLAGEHTQSVGCGYTHGAVDSGRRAAGAVVAGLQRG